jgi:hypothetical protein
MYLVRGRALGIAYQVKAGNGPAIDPLDKGGKLPLNLEPNLLLRLSLLTCKRAVNDVGLREFKRVSGPLAVR